MHYPRIDHEKHTTPVHGRSGVLHEIIATSSIIHLQICIPAVGYTLVAVQSSTPSVLYSNRQQ